MILATLVDTGALVKVVLFSLFFGIGVTTLFSLGIVGVTRFDESRRGGAGSGGIVWAALALVCGLGVAAVVVEAIVVMTSK